MEHAVGARSQEFCSRAVFCLGASLASVLMLGGAALNALKASRLVTGIGKVISRVVPKLTAGMARVAKTGGTAARKAREAILKRFGSAAPIVVTQGAAALRRVSSKLREKILWGSLREPGGRSIIGGHFRGLLGHPKYVHEVVGVSSVNPGCIKVKFIKLLPDGRLSNIKSPASTLFPKGWSKSDIIMDDVAGAGGLGGALVEKAGEPGLGAILELGGGGAVDLVQVRVLEILAGAVEAIEVREGEAGQRDVDAAGAQGGEERHGAEDVVAAAAPGEQDAATAGEARQDGLFEHGDGVTRTPSEAQGRSGGGAARG